VVTVEVVDDAVVAAVVAATTTMGSPRDRRPRSWTASTKELAAESRKEERWRSPAPSRALRTRPLSHAATAAATMPDMIVGLGLGGREHAVAAPGIVLPCEACDAARPPLVTRRLLTVCAPTRRTGCVDLCVYVCEVPKNINEVRCMKWGGGRDGSGGALGREVAT
jgi:hypothetical protein